METLKISLCITNYNRCDMVLESFKEIINDDRISEIVISDDCSDLAIYELLSKRIDGMPKVKLFRNDVKVGMAANKILSVSRASNEWCIVFDSDNMLFKQYIDSVYVLSEWNENTIYCPDFAMPNFDYRKFSGIFFNSININRYIDEPLFDCLLNTCNYFVNRKNYVNAYVQDTSIIASDTIFYNYNWLKYGYGFHVVNGMQYFHRVHDKSGFLEKADYNLKKAEETKNLIKQL